MQKLIGKAPDWATVSIYPNIRLVVFNGANQIGCISLAQGKHFVFGNATSTQCDIPTEDPAGSVDDAHCTITHHTNGRPYLMDLGSRHGTLLTPATAKQAVKIAPQNAIALEEGSIINIGLSPIYYVLKGSLSTDPSVDEVAIICTPQVYKHTLLNGRKRTPEELKRLELIEAAKRKPKKRKGVHWAAEIEQAEPTQHHALTGSETRIGGSGLFGEVGRFALWSTESKTDPGVGQFQNLVSETRLERGVKNVGQVSKSPVFNFSKARNAEAASPTSPTGPAAAAPFTQNAAAQYAAEATEPPLPRPPRKRRRFPLPAPPAIPAAPPNNSNRKHFFPPLVFKSRETAA